MTFRLWRCFKVMGKIVKPVWYFISCMDISLNHGENCKASLVLHLLKKKHFVSFQVMGKCFFKVTLAVPVAHDKDFILCTCTNNKTTNKIFSKNPRLYNEAKQMQERGKKYVKLFYNCTRQNAQAFLQLI